MVLGHADDMPVVLARIKGDVFAVSGSCTHYGGPVGRGLFDGELLKCPWHHAAFDVRTGKAVQAPALNPLPRFEVEERDGRLYVGEQIEYEWNPPRIEEPPDSVVVVGAGAAASTAVETLRGEGYLGPVTMIGAEETVPTDRPNLSKDYLAGTAPEEWMRLRSESFYEDLGISFRLGTSVTAIDREGRTIKLDDGSDLSYGALLLAPGADPIQFPLPGADLPHVHMLRTLANAEAIISGAETASSAVVLGASFIGLEVAASLRNRGIEVHVVAPEDLPMARILGTDIGRFIQGLHESHGVDFHLGHVASEIEADHVLLDDGTTIAADLVVMGVGVRPTTALAEATGLELDNGIVVDEQLRTTDPHIWAAGDAIDYPDRRLGRPIRVEHWVVAQRHGQVAAQNILGRHIPFLDPPFFWSQHYDIRINYVGHAERWDGYEVTGSIEDGDALIAYREEGEITAVATIGRDVDSLRAQAAMERGDNDALEAML